MGKLPRSPSPPHRGLVPYQTQPHVMLTWEYSGFSPGAGLWSGLVSRLSLAPLPSWCFCQERLGQTSQFSIAKTVCLRQSRISVLFTCQHGKAKVSCRTREAQVLLCQEGSMQDAARGSGFGCWDLGDKLFPGGPDDQSAADLGWPWKGISWPFCDYQPWVLGAVLASRGG